MHPFTMASMSGARSLGALVVCGALFASCVLSVPDLEPADPPGSGGAGAGLGGGGGHGAGEGGGGDTSVGGAGGVGGASGECEGTLTYAATVLCDEPLVYWKLDETSPPVAADSSGNGHDAILAGGIVVGEPGVSGTAVQFGTGGDLAELRLAAGNLLDFSGLAEFTLEAWVKLGTPPPGCCAALFFDAPAGEGYYLSVMDTGRLIFLREVGDSTTTAYGANALPTQSFAHVAATFDGFTMRVYEDGVLVDSKLADEELVDDEGDFVVGSYGTWGPFRGVLDEVAIYAVALTEGRIVAHHAAGSAMAGSRAR
jgi:hypothetical protein